MAYRRVLQGVGFGAVVFAALVSHGVGQIAVKHPVGARHGFLTIHSQSGANLGYAELSEYAVGDMVNVKFVLHFLDGSIDDETTVFRQGKTFQFVSDHHIQRGKFFPKPNDITIEANGRVTTQTTDKDGKMKTDVDQMQITPDFANGMVGTVMENIAGDSGEFKLGMIVPTPKPRAIKLDVTPAGEQTMRIAGTSRKLSVYQLKLELGGVVGVLAPLVGKQPANIYISVLEGEVPTVVRIVEQVAEGTPVLDVALAGATFARGTPVRK